MWRAYKAMFTVRQKEEEDLRSYYEKFTNSQEVVENYGGTIGKENDMYLNNSIYKRLNETNKKKADKIEEARVRQQKRMIAYGFLEGLDKKRYGNLNEDLENQFTFGNDNNPNDVQAAYEYATNYKKYKPKSSNNNRRGCDGLSFTTTRGSGNNNSNNNGNNNTRNCWGNRCYGNCNNPECTAPGLAN